MSGILDISVSGLSAATRRIAKDASSLVNASSTPNSVKNAPAAPAGNLDKDIVDLKVSQVNYQANAFTIKTAEKLQKALLDIKT